MRPVVCPITLQPGQDTKVLIQFEAGKPFPGCPRVLIRVSTELVRLKLPITLLSFSRKLSVPPQEIIDSLAEYTAVSEFTGLNTAFRSLKSIGEALRFGESLHLFSGAEVSGLGRTGLALCGDIAGTAVACKVVLTPSADGGQVTILSRSDLLRAELLTLFLCTLRPAR